MEQTQLPEHFPTIITEVAACEGIDNIDINIWRVSERLANKGLTPQQIDETTIIISAKKFWRGKTPVTGRYDEKTKSVMIFPVLSAQRYTEKYNNAESDKEIDLEYRYGGEKVAWGLDWSLQHELEHRVVDAEGGMPEEIKHKKIRNLKMTSVGIGYLFGATLSWGAKETFAPSHSVIEMAVTPLISWGVWLAGAVKLIDIVGDKAYRKSPEENRARAAESNDPKEGLFTVRMVYQNQPMRKMNA